MSIVSRAGGTWHSKQMKQRDAEITRLRARIAELEAVCAYFGSEAEGLHIARIAELEADRDRLRNALLTIEPETRWGGKLTMAEINALLRAALEEKT